MVLADHHEQARLGLDILLKEHPEFGLIGDAMDAKGLLLLVEKHSADLVLMDAELPGCPTVDLIASLRALEPRPIIIVMSSDIAYSRLLLNAGADAFVSKVDDPAWIVGKLKEYARQVEMK